MAARMALVSKRRMKPSKLDEVGQIRSRSGDFDEEDDEGGDAWSAISE